MQLTINGEPKDLPGEPTLAEAIAALRLDMRLSAAELNREIVPRSRYEATRLNDGDRLEFVTFIGGG